MVYAASIHTGLRLSVAEVLISLMYSQALIMSSLSFKYSKAANLLWSHPQYHNIKYIEINKVYKK
jgi:hypothetical protein